MDHWLHHATWLGNTASAWIIAGVSAVVGCIIVFAATRIVAARLSKAAEHHPDSKWRYLIASVARATRGWVLLLLAIAIALHSLSFGAKIDGYLYMAIGALIGIQIAFWICALLVSMLKGAGTGGGMEKKNPVIFSMLVWAVELVVWVTLLLILLGNAGVQVGAFIASLGVGGIAVALAAKNVLQDLFASIAIGLDKPFTVGEFITFGDSLGTVKKVGIRSTRIEALSGEEIAISNSNIAQMQTNNLSRREERRVVFDFYVPLDTPRDKVSAIIEAVNGMIDAEEQVRRDRGNFRSIARDGFQLQFVYYVLVPSMNVYCDIHEAFNLKIMETLESFEVHFALPVQLEKLEDSPSYNNKSA
ncbi:MAG TPA: mechanosensitive ion channel family protein [Oleiagrimonas sp.]|nr:mechanosensitive ion channel family protein [Oleiagrimonas sp.]